MIGRVLTVVFKELRGYFDHATAYILLVVFLGINGFFFFQSAYELGEASLRPMLGLLPWLLLFFVPAVCMRTLAEERHEGTLELVLAQPIGVVEFLLGKFLGVLAFLLIAMLATLVIPLGLAFGADLQWGVIFAQYVGAGLLIASMIAIGLWASSMTQNQVTAFILGVTIAFGLYMIGLEVVYLALPGPLSVIASRLGILGHFENVARGVIDLRDVLYFGAVTGAFLALTYHSLMRERLSRTGEAYRRLRYGVLGLVGLSIVAALAGAQLRGRLDLTPGKLYTLSPATRDLLRGLEDVVTIRFFRSDELPPAYAPLRRDIEDVLRDFDAAGGTNLNLIQLAPDEEEEALEQAENLGIPPARFTIIGDAERSTREGYLGIAVQYAGESDAIPLVQATSDLEYRLASMIRSMTRERRPTVAIYQGHGELDLSSSMRFATARLQEEYEVELLGIDSARIAIPDSIDVVVLPGPTTPLAPADGQQLGAYLENGGSLLVLRSGTRVDQTSGLAGPDAYPVIESVLSTYGLGIVPAMAYDLASNEVVPLPTTGGYVLQQYPAWPIVGAGADHPIVRNTNPIALQWPSPVVYRGEDSTRFTPLLVTTEYGGQLGNMGSVRPDVDWPGIASEADLRPLTLAMAYQDSSGVRIVVAGTPSFVNDQFIQNTSAGAEGLTFFQNAVDWLAQDESLISIRSKDRSPPMLLFESAFVRDAAKWGNIVGVPLLFILFGVFRVSRRRGTQRKVYESGGALL